MNDRLTRNSQENAEMWRKKNQLKKDNDKRNISETMLKNKYKWKQW